MINQKKKTFLVSTTYCKQAGRAASIFFTNKFNEKRRSTKAELVEDKNKILDTIQFYFNPFETMSSAFGCRYFFITLTE